MVTPLKSGNKGWIAPTEGAERLTWTGLGRLLAVPALVLVLFGAVQLQAQSTDYLEAKERYERQEYLMAMLAAQKAVQQDGENADYRHLYGMTLLQLNQYSDAEPELRKALALDPSKADFHYGVAALILQQRSETEDPTDPMGMGARNETSEPVEKAIPAPGKSPGTGPRPPQGQDAPGAHLPPAEHEEQALRQFEAVVARDPGYAWAHYHLAAFYLDAGKFREALQALRQEVKDHPDAGQARLELADLLLQLGKPKLALSQLTAVSPGEPNGLAPRSPLRSGQGLSQTRATGQGDCGHRQSIRLLPDNPVAHRLLAGLYRDAGQSEQARQALNSYRELKERIERYSR